MDLDDVKKRLQVFNKFHFEEEPHIYWWLDEEGNYQQADTSMTAIIETYAQEFDKEKMAKRCAHRDGITVDEVLANWQFKNDFSKVKGTHIHAFNENLWQDKPYTYPKDKIIEQFGYDVLEPIWGHLTEIAQEFHDKYQDRIIPIGLELVVGDEDIRIGGSIDFLAYSKKFDRLIIIDYKSNTSIKFESYKNQKMKGFLSHLDDCNFVHYSLQLNGYQYLLEKHTGLKLHNTHYLIWMNEHNKTFQIYQTLDLYKEAKQMLESHNHKSKKGEE